MNTKEPKIINIVSGKGGTGKTLMVAVLADMLSAEKIPTLTIDLDVFVRGLTVLLYYQKKQSNKLISDEKLSISDIFKNKWKINGLLENKLFRSPLGISPYRSFDVLPAVKRVNELLDFKEIMPTFEEANEIIKALLNTLKREEQYKIILIDSRAGYDELILSTTQNSNITLCVEEDDAISRITADNLVNQLEKNVENGNRPYRLINKARHTNNITSSVRTGYLGVIPFDIDVMNSFGNHSFWEDIASSLYRKDLADIWNQLCIAEELTEYKLHVKRKSPVGFEALEKRIALLNQTNRLLFVYGILLSILGLAVAITGSKIIDILINDPYRAFGAIAVLLGISISLFVVFKRGLK